MDQFDNTVKYLSNSHKRMNILNEQTNKIYFCIFSK